MTIQAKQCFQEIKALTVSHHEVYAKEDSQSYFKLI